MQLSQSSRHLWDGRAVHLHQDLQKVSAMRNDLLLTLNRTVLVSSVEKSLSQTKSVTIQPAKAARGKSLLETFLHKSPVWGIIHAIFFQHFCNYNGIENVTCGNPEV